MKTEKMFEHLDKKFDKIDMKIDNIQTDITDIKVRCSSCDNRIKNLEAFRGNIIKTVLATTATAIGTVFITLWNFFIKR